MTKRASAGRRTVGIILAAGSSSRMGRPKQLLPYRGKPLLQHTLDLAAPLLPEVIVVLGHAADEIQSALTFPSNARAVLNPDYASGQGASLRAGLASAGDGWSSAVILLGDQPGIGAEVLRMVLEEHKRSGAPVVRTAYAGVPGHPVVLEQSVWQELGADSGDVGARAWIAMHPERVATIALPSPPPIEVDTEEDYLRLLETE
ncbi:MAG: nucleotidyltransferase family protein [Gemmatimonadota bacterium]